MAQTTAVNGKDLPIGIINPALLNADKLKAKEEEKLSNTPLPFGKGEYLPALVKASDTSDIKPDVNVAQDTKNTKEATTTPEPTAVAKKPEAPAKSEEIPNEIEIKATKGLWLSKIAMTYDVEEKDAPLEKLSKALAEYNGIKDANKIKIGQTIKIPKTLVVDGKTYTFGKEATEASIKKDIENNIDTVYATKHKQKHQHHSHLVFKTKK